jgi:hypothetical protein
MVNKFRQSGSLLDMKETNQNAECSEKKKQMKSALGLNILLQMV